jgi:hypothetical protein
VNVVGRATTDKVSSGRCWARGRGSGGELFLAAPATVRVSVAESGDHPPGGWCHCGYVGPRHDDDMGDLAPSDVRLGVVASQDA